jgi:hypothetical protein
VRRVFVHRLIAWSAIVLAAIHICAVAGGGHPRLYAIGVAILVPAALMLAAGRLERARSFALGIVSTGALALASAWQLVRFDAAFPALFTALAVADGVALSTLPLVVDGRWQRVVAILGRILIALAFLALAALVVLAMREARMPEP